MYWRWHVEEGTLDNHHRISDIGHCLDLPHPHIVPLLSWLCPLQGHIVRTSEDAVYVRL